MVLQPFTVITWFVLTSDNLGIGMPVAVSVVVKANVEQFD